MSLEIIPVPCLEDNYAYLVLKEGTNEAVVIDACEAAPIEAELTKRNLKLTAILTTHHHHDHVGGNQNLVERWKAPVVGHFSESSRIPGLSTPLRDGEELTVGKLSFRALHVPAHTRGALAYVTLGACFTGDTLFTGGAGRLFEGTPEDLFRALFFVLGRLSPSTMFYTGHEYTLKNLTFARRIDPHNQALQTRYEEVVAKRKSGEYSAMASLALERQTNPFLRVDRPEVARGLGLEVDTDPVFVMMKLREARNHF
jgi:hydroxyacylglutathione hydrolase